MYFCVLTIIFFQSLIARSQEKSCFLHEQMESWDCLVEEARLRGDMTAQLVAAQQRVAELTPLAEEADSLRLLEAEARRHADEVFSYQHPVVVDFSYQLLCIWFIVVHFASHLNMCSHMFN